MKVIIIKDCKNGKVNDVVDVSDGFAKNFLIRQGFAISYNESNAKKRNTALKVNQDLEDKNITAAINAKDYIESLKPVFFLKEQNNVIYGSITKKQLVEFLKTKNVKLNTPHDIKNFHIKSLGTSRIPIKVYNKIYAEITIEIKKDPQN